jgi:hypothetical protein
MSGNISNEYLLNFEGETHETEFSIVDVDCDSFDPPAFSLCARSGSRRGREACHARADCRN